MPNEALPERGINVPLTPQEAWVIATLLGIAALSAVVWLAMPKDAVNRHEWLTKFRAALGIAEWPPFIAVLAFALWILLFLVLFFGLLIGAVEVIANLFGPPGRDAIATRLPLITIATLTATLGAVVALPFTLIKRLHSDRQTKATEEGLITDRINAAVQGLGAEKTVKTVFEIPHFERDDTGAPIPTLNPEGKQIVTREPHETTAPNLEVRIGAILALERLAKNNLDVHVQIMEILCAYVRNNAPAKQAADVHEFELKPDEEDGPIERDWNERWQAYRVRFWEALAKLEPREDIVTAMQVIGRRTAEQKQAEAEWGNGGKGASFVFDQPCPEPPENDAPSAAWRTWANELLQWQKDLATYSGYRLDLRATDLQKIDLQNLDFAGAHLGKARLQGANLGGALLQGANLRKARLQLANLRWARLQGANLWQARLQMAELWQARLQGANLRWARLQGANLSEAALQGADLNQAGLHGAHLRKARLQGADLRQAGLQGANLGRASLQLAHLEQATFDDATSLSAAILRGAALRDADLTNIQLSTEQIQSMFGDGSVTLPGGKGHDSPDWPAHWPKQMLEVVEFRQKWREWQETLRPEASEGS